MKITWRTSLAEDEMQRWSGRWKWCDRREVRILWLALLSFTGTGFNVRLQKAKEYWLSFSFPGESLLSTTFNQLPLSSSVGKLPNLTWRITSRAHRHKAENNSSRHLVKSPQAPLFAHYHGGCWSCLLSHRRERNSFWLLLTHLFSSDPTRSPNVNFFFLNACMDIIFIRYKTWSHSTIDTYKTKLYSQFLRSLPYSESEP